MIDKLLTIQPAVQRREMLQAGAAIASSLILPGKAGAMTSEEPLRGKAEHVISIWLGGGMGQGDTFDPKTKGDPITKKPGSYYDSIETAVAGVRVCEHLKTLAPLMDRMTAVRTVNHESLTSTLRQPIACTPDDRSVAP